MKRGSALLVTLLLAGCKLTYPWSDGSDDGPAAGASTGGTFQVAPTALRFTAVTGGSAPASQDVAVQVTSGGVLFAVSTEGAAVASASLLVDGPTSGRVRVTAPPPEATPGVRTGSVTITGCADPGCTHQVQGSPQVVTVTYDVQQDVPQPSISVAPAALALTAVAGTPAAPQVVTIDRLPGTAPWSTAVSYGSGATGWLQLSPASGTALPTAMNVVATFPASTPSGTYTATLDVTCLGVTRSVSVTAAVTRPRLTSATDRLDFSALRLAPTLPAAQTITVGSDTGTGLGYTTSVQYGAVSGWLQVAPSGTAPGTLDIGVTSTGAAAGTHTATLRLTPSNGAAATEVTVVYVVTSPRVLVEPASLLFDAVREQYPLPASQPATLTGEGGQEVGWTSVATYGASASGWLSVVPSGTTPGSLAVAVTRADLPTGTHTASIQLRPSNGAAATDLAVTYRVSAPELVVSPGTLGFTVDAATSHADLEAPVYLAASGGPISWTAEASQSWVQVSASSGTTPATPIVSIATTALETLPPGEHAASLTFTYATGGGAAVPLTLPVTLLVDLPLLERVMPYVSVADVGGEVVLRGRGFAAPFTGTLRIGTTPAPAPSRDTSTQLRFTPPTSLTAGRHVVTVENALGLSRSMATVEVVAAVTRSAAAVASAGRKAKVIFDDARKALYVVNTGAGRIDRHRESQGWVKAAGTTDEIALAGLKNATLSPDGASLLTVTGTSFRVVDLDTFALTSRQPGAGVTAPADTLVHLETTNAGKALYLGSSTGWPSCGLFDLETLTTSSAGAPCSGLYLGSLAAGANGARVAAFQQGILPAPPIVSWDAAAGVAVTTDHKQEGWFGSFDRTASRLLVFGRFNSTLHRRESVLYDASWNVQPGTVADTLLAVMLSPLGGGRAYGWDGSALVVYDIAGPPGVTGLHPVLSTTSIAAADRPGARPVMALAADERTAFLAGDDRVTVVPLP